MLLKDPVMITARLMPGVKIGDAFVSIEYSDHEGRDGRTRYSWYVDLADGREFSGDDLQSGCGGGSLQAGLESLLSFLGAFAESWQYFIRNGGEMPVKTSAQVKALTFEVENMNLFHAGMAEWAMQNSDEISMLAIELEETKDLIDEDAGYYLQAGNIG